MQTSALYIHIPWCIRKCPYCDFNSHKSPDTIPEENYVDQLIADFRAELDWISVHSISSIFIGGGTPSLFSAQAYVRLFDAINQLVPLAPQLEITLEANPGTIEQRRFNEYRQAGINRLSLGIQSFNAAHLKTLGRIHDDRQAHRAIEAARNAGFNNINIDLMHGLPGQSIAEGLEDLNQALSYHPEHLSWYQLTIEPNTVFYKKRPTLPSEDEACLLEEKGFELLHAAGFERYEISAFCRQNKYSAHNLNYWLFGDYLGIGAGAHGKLTDPNGLIYRTRKQRQPTDYLNPAKAFLAEKEQVSLEALPFEFMLNTTRLNQPISKQLFEERTGLSFQQIKPIMDKAAQQGLIMLHEKYWQITPLGRRYTNNLEAMFLPD